MLTPQNKAYKLSQSYLSNGVSHLEWCLSLFMVKKGLCREIEQKLHFLGAVKLYCLSSHKNFFIKFVGHGITPVFSEIIWPSAFR